jgi:hypothetical protein
MLGGDLIGSGVLIHHAEFAEILNFDCPVCSIINLVCYTADKPSNGTELDERVLL